MSGNSAKSWNRPWSTQEIIDNASNWSLAGDAGLLKYLESFSEDMLTKAEETHNNLNKLLKGLDEASLNLDIVKNEFSSLHNTQFIENRVYEDDETLPTEEAQENVEDKKQTEEERIKDLKEAVMRGIEVVDKYYEKMEVPGSDTEDEADFPSFVLRPKDPYIDRPLPYVIGTEEWHNKWHVGLLDSSSDSEVDKVSEKFSDSDSDDDLPIQDRTRAKGISNSGSEVDISNPMRINKPVANSTFDESVKQPDIFGSSDSDDYNSVPAQAPISTRNFAQELAAKLGNVVEQNTHVTEPEVNRRPIQNQNTVPPTRTIGNLFSDEPPPIDQEEDELFGNSSAQRGMFSGGGGLFDDLEDDGGFWKDKKVEKQKAPEVNVSAPKPKVHNLFDDEDNDIFNAVPPSVKPKMENLPLKKPIENLFDDEDDLFQEVSSKAHLSKPYLPPVSKMTMPYFEEEPPELEPKAANANENDKAKKPVGGVKIFGDADLFAQQKVGDLLKNRRQDSSESSDNISRKSVEIPRVTDEPKDLFNDFSKKQEDVVDRAAPKEDKETEQESEKKQKRLSLFDDDADSNLFEDDLFSNISTKKFTSSLFENNPLEDDLFAPAVIKKSPEGGGRTLVEVPAPPETPARQEATTSGTIQQSDSMPKVKAVSLFDDEHDNDDPDDIFSTNVLPKLKVSSVLESETVKSEAVSESDTSTLKDAPRTSASNATTQSRVNINLFDQNPPDLDDDWDTKSENNLFEDNDALFDNTPEVSSRRSGLFDNEPPSLFSESSGIVRDVSSSARAETDDSFNPYASSSRRFSTDIFSEQQSSDSFFVTKNKSHLDAQHSVLDRIPERANMNANVTSQSNLEITPSGNVDDLFTDSTVEQNSTKGYYVEKPKLVLQDSEDYDLFTDENFLPQKIGDSNTAGNKKLFHEPPADLFAAEKTFDEDTSITSDSAKKVEKAFDGDTSTTTESAKKERTFDGDTPESAMKVEDTSKPELIKPKPMIAKKPSKSPSMDVGISSDSKKTEIENTVAAKIGSPGKLKHNLNINVNALMPGVSPPKKKELEKSHSFEVASLYEDNIMQISVKSDLADGKPKTIEKSVSFDNPSGAPEVLPSITKDRARIPVKRRPSTRKGRHESLRNSMPDFKISPIDGEPQDKLETTTSEEKPAGETKTDFEDIFAEDLFSSNTINVAQKDISKISSVKQQKDNSKSVLFESPNSANGLFGENLVPGEDTIQATKNERQEDKSKISLFDSPDLNDDLFGAQKSNSVPVKKVELFSSPDLDDDLFGASSNPKIVIENKGASEPQKDDNIVEEQPKPSIFGSQRRSVINSDSFESTDFKSDLFEESEDFDDIFSSKKLPPKSNILKKSLFDDELDDDDDDIFGPPVSTSKKVTVATKVPERKQPKTVQVKKLENSEAVEDPLSSFLDS